MSNIARAVRDLADAYITARVELDPFAATFLGITDDRMRDLSPAAQDAYDELDRRTLRSLDDIGDTYADDDERRCARLLRERLTAELALSEIGEHLRPLRNIGGSVQTLRTIFTLMPAATEDDWAVIARRMARMRDATTGLVASLTEGARRGLCAASRQVTTVADQLSVWADGEGWFTDFVAPAQVSAALRGDLAVAARAATDAAQELRTWLVQTYLPLAEGTPDAVGADRYRVCARSHTGADLDLVEAYDWGWSEYRRLAAEIAAQVELIRPAGTLADAVAYLDEHGEVVEGVDTVQRRLQDMIDTAISDLDGTHFDLADPVKICESRIAPEGSAAAPYYTRPSIDFARPGRTWLPTQGMTSFPLWRLVSTWYHESVPGHHLQFAHWVTLAAQLSRYQTGFGSVSAMTEGWALYAERLMDEFGYLNDPGARLSYLTSQIMRAIRVIIDIGMHLQLDIPAESPIGAGQTWTPELASAFMFSASERPQSFVDSEIVRYLGMPGQAIGYKLGERAWVAGRDAARQAKGGAFDLKSWHMAALSLGAMGLDDLTTELSGL